MTDFFADLEAELRGAAHRRAAPRPHRLRLTALVAPLAAAAACAAVLVVALGRGEPAGDERPATVPAPAPAAAPACAPADQSLRAPVGSAPLRIALAVPAFRRTPEPDPLTEAATRALRDLDPIAAYVDATVNLDAGQGIVVSAVPVRGARRPCASVRPVGWQAFRGPGACLLASRSSELVATLCLPLRGLRLGGLSPRRLQEGTLVLGFGEPTFFQTAGGGRAALPGLGGIHARVVADSDRARVPPGRTVVVEGGHPPPPAVPQPDARPGPGEWKDKTPATGKPVPPGRTLRQPVVAFLNGTTRPGLASAAAERFVGRARGGDLPRADTAPDQTVERTLVLYAEPDLRTAAEAAAAATGAPGPQVERVTLAELRRHGGLAHERIVVVLGSDVRMR